MVTYTLPSNLGQDHFYLEGNWQDLADSMKLASANRKIVLPYYAKDVHIVATGPNSDIQILLDGNPITGNDAGQDVQNGVVHVAENRLYNIVSSQQAGSHTLTVVAKPGFQIYTFTFGWRLSKNNVAKFEFRNIRNLTCLIFAVTTLPCNRSYITLQNMNV